MCCKSYILSIYGAHRDFDEHPLVDVVLPVEVDSLDAEPPKAALARRPHVRRIATDLLVFGDDAELGG